MINYIYTLDGKAVIKKARPQTVDKNYTESGYDEAAGCSFEIDLADVIERAQMIKAYEDAGDAAFFISSDQ